MKLGQTDLLFPANFFHVNDSKTSIFSQVKYPLEEFGTASFLMVGCGNSKMSEEMARDGYPFIDNMDISPVVLEKMRNLY